MNTICGIDCSGCPMKENCKGCAETSGKPFGGECVTAECYKTGGEICFKVYKEALIEEFNALGIADMPKITEICWYVNTEVTVQMLKLWYMRGDSFYVKYFKRS